MANKIYEITIFHHLTWQTAVVEPFVAVTAAPNVSAHHGVAAALQTPAAAPCTFVLLPQTQVPVIAEHTLALFSVHVLWSAVLHY